jgi:hypothetical protein
VRATARILQQLESELGFVHKQRRAALLRAVDALICGGALWLSALGRTLSSAVAPRHRIKAIDRLLGNTALHQQRLWIYAALAALLLRGRREAVVLVDVTEIRPGVCAMTASLAMDGRSVPIYGHVRSKKTISKRSSNAAFLKALQRVLPRTVTPILVTDAGFESPWFDQVTALGWHYVGRVRHQTKFLLDGEWVGVQRLHELATSWARCLGKLAFPKQRPAKRRLVLSIRPELKGRSRKNTYGRKGRTRNDRRCAKSAREPWLLATSLDYSNPLVVSIYAMRMQIEQNYRDAKNHRWGWRLDQSRSRSNERIEMLLLIAAIAMFVVLAFGCAAERAALHRRYQANTLYSRRVLSFFTLGLFVLRDEFSTAVATAAQLITEIRSRIYCLPAFR